LDTSGLSLGHVWFLIGVNAGFSNWFHAVVRRAAQNKKGPGVAAGAKARQYDEKLAM
jgi:hypothetical protein